MGKGGTSSNAGAGGNALLQGGNGATNGGTVTIKGGTHGGGSTGGDVIIKTGGDTTRGKVQVYKQLAAAASIACTGSAASYSRTCTVTSSALAIDLTFRWLLFLSTRCMSNNYGDKYLPWSG